MVYGIIDGCSTFNYWKVPGRLTLTFSHSDLQRRRFCNAGLVNLRIEFFFHRHVTTVGQEIFKVILVNINLCNKAIKKAGF